MCYTLVQYVHKYIRMYIQIVETKASQNNTDSYLRGIESCNFCILLILFLSVKNCELILIKLIT